MRTFHLRLQEQKENISKILNFDNRIAEDELRKLN